MIAPDALFEWITRFGHPSLFVLLAAGIIGLPIPDETLMAFSGYLIYKGTFSPVATYATAFAGSACGITLSYAIGRGPGRRLIARFGPRVHITPERMDKARAWFDRLGKWTLVVGYFVPGVRHVTAVVAGSSNLRFPVFAVFAYTGSLLWSATFITAGYLIGDGWSRIPEQAHRWMLIASVVAAVPIAAFLIVRRMRSGRSR